MPRVHIYPSIDDGPDPGHGGIYRVIHGQQQALPTYGWEVVDDPNIADVIACHVQVPRTYLNRFPDKPLVVHNHGLYWTEYDWGERWCYIVNREAIDAVRLADAVTAVSEWTAQAIRRNTARDVRVVCHGVDASEWEPVAAAERGRYVLWNKTRIDPVCDPTPVVELAALMPDQAFVSTFLASEAARNVRLTGKLPYDEAREHVRHAGVYLCTTRETFGIGTLEALAAGVPVVGFSWGGQREFIEHGRNGWLVAPGDIAGLAEGVEWALAERDAIEPEARATALRFTIERAAEQYAQVYEEALVRRETGSVRRWVISGDRLPKVSVIVTAYNLESYLEECLDSVLAQTTDDWECVIVDDASPDDSGKIADAYAARDSRFRVVHNAQNVYLAEARNIGIRAARGRYIIPLDADDRLAPGALAVLAEALDRDPHTEIAYGNVRFFQPDQQTLMVYPEAKHRGFPDGRSGWPVPFRLDWMLRGPGQLLPYCSMFRRRVWELTGGYRRRCRSSEDQEFFLRAASYGFEPRMVTEADTLLYTVREGSMSSGSGEGWEDHRGWFPWAGERGDPRLVPGGAVQTNVKLEDLPMPAYEPLAVSVVIPVGPGHDKYLVDAVDSVDAQTYRAWECIVVNDSGEPLPDLPSWIRVIETHCERCWGAGDTEARDTLDGPEGVAICDACGGSGIGRFGGVAAARNAGIRASRAPLFLPLDADDYLQPNAIEIMLAAHNRTDAIVYSDFWEDVHGEWTVYETPDFQPDALTRHGTLHPVTALTPKAVWQEVGGYPEDLPWEDWAFQILTAARGHCSVRLAAPLLSYRKHTGLRRNENVRHFEESKRAIVAHDFGIPRGGLTVACAGCGSGPRSTLNPQDFRGFVASRSGRRPSEDAVLITYTGERAGNFTFRSRVNPQIDYQFSKVDPVRWVHKLDAEAFLLRHDFAAADEAAVAAGHGIAVREPIVAARTPPMTEAPDAIPGFGTQIAAPSEPPFGSEVQEGGEADRERSELPRSDEMTPDGATGTPAPSGATLSELLKWKREALDAEAARLGVEEPAKLPNKTMVAQAIVAARSLVLAGPLLSHGLEPPA